MEQIQHKVVESQGLNLHIADIGTGNNNPLLASPLSSATHFPFLIFFFLKSNHEKQYQAQTSSYSSTAFRRYGTRGGTRW